MDKQLTLGDKTYNLRFKLGVLKHIEAISGRDGLSFVQSAGTNMVHGLSVLVIAAVYCWFDKHGGTRPVEDEIYKAVEDDGDLSHFSKIIEWYGLLLNPQGEQKAKEVESLLPSQTSENEPSNQDLSPANSTNLTFKNSPNT